ncbi:extracellular metalloprotease [Boeremia exigua]|uniref:extracellular metalloprotease n=1 Tax=Boeremia exigua TaxID=749465 RepID=UPI001E8CB8CE|nr:extracellular metalloprotease [Boeremia exigua]KAH6639290.1 extracellular metalloprotease [Boeremia exigua]
MQLKTLLVSLLVSSAAAKRSCGTPNATAEQIQVAQNLQILEAESNASGARLAAAAATINIKVYWHVTATARTVASGYLTQATLDKQLAVLNSAYAPHGISFSQAGVDWTVNSNYANDRADLTMKKALRKGTYADLNVYFVPGTQYLGYAYFPQAVTANSNAFFLDGVVIRSSTVPGGSEKPFDLGHTATHEVGHWLGLYHTFEGGCTGNGDFVSDTPAEASEAFDCQLTRDSCPNQAGLDPVTNYMDYSDDACFTGFTTGQETRIFSYWNQYRAGK